MAVDRIAPFVTSCQTLSFNFIFTSLTFLCELCNYNPLFHKTNCDNILVNNCSLLSSEKCTFLTKKYMNHCRLHKYDNCPFLPCWESFSRMKSDLTLGKIWSPLKSAKSWETLTTKFSAPENVNYFGFIVVFFSIWDTITHRYMLMLECTYSHNQKITIYF